MSLSQDIDIYQFTFNDVSYEVIKTAATAANAARDAVSRGGKLVEIESTEEQDAIFAAITNDAGITAANTVAPDGGEGHTCGSEVMISQSKETGYGMEIMI